MAFGIKIKKIKFNNEYTIESLYEAIKDKSFTAGEPELVKYMTSTVIVFPALDSTNQVQIMALSKKPSVKFVVQKGDELSLNGAVKNVVVGDLTGGFATLTRAFGRNAKICEKLVDQTVKEITDFNL